MPSLLGVRDTQSTLKHTFETEKEPIHKLANGYNDAVPIRPNGDYTVKSGQLTNGLNGSSTGANGRVTTGKTQRLEQGALEKIRSSTTAINGSDHEDCKPTMNGASTRLGKSMRDDGLFVANADSNPEERRFRSTRVSLEAIPSGADGSHELDLTESPTETQHTFDSLSIPKPGSYSYPETAPRASNSSSQRVSSPPSLPPLQQTSTAGSVPQGNVGPRLQHRHTLEVPKVSTSRISREFPGAAAEDAAVATGRFSPSSPTRRRASTTLPRRHTRSIQSDMLPEDLQHDEDAVRWADQIRQKRASKRRRKEDEDEDRVVVGTKVDQNHVNWETAYNMLTGIRFTVSRTNAKMLRPLEDVDFEAKHKYSFDVTGNELTPSSKYDFKFKDYAPWVFRHLRQTFKQDPADYLMSLTSKYILSELGSPGKSGSFFYFSRDYKYIIKTIHHAEHKFLRRILREYYNHVQDNPDTLLSQFYGLHRVKVPYGRKIHFVVMNNLFPPHRDIHKTFDLKGSTIGRDFKEDDLEKNPRATLKDLNWLRRDLHLEFGPTKKQAFIEQMERDVKLLQRLKIMDYSMLIGIHELEKGNEENLREKTLQVFQPGGEDAEDVQPGPLIRTPSKLETARKAKELRQMIKQQKPVPMHQTMSKMPEEATETRKDFYFYGDEGGFRATHEDDRPGEEIYYLGIIDCLTHYSLIKRMEHFLKGISNEESQISAIPPQRYGDRFLRFIAGNTKSREEAEREKVEAEREEEEPHQALDHRARSATEKVMDEAEEQAERSRRRGRSEDNVPDRHITVVRSPSAERGENGHTLPIVEEAGESSSVGGRSRGSFRSNNGEISATAGSSKQQGIQSHSTNAQAPPTPPKDEREWDDDRHRPPTPPKDGPPTPPKDQLAFRGRDTSKSLPTIPREQTNDLAPPIITHEYTRSPSRVKGNGVEMEEVGLRVRTVN